MSDIAAAATTTTATTAEVAPTTTTTTRTSTPPPLPKETCKKRPVIVSLPPKKHHPSHPENHSWSEGTVPGPEPPCHFCAAHHHHHHPRPHNTEIIEPVSTLFLHQKPSATNKMEPSLSSCSSSIESASPTMDDEPPTQQQHEDSEEVTKKQLPPQHPFAVLQHHGTLYDDPAVVHVIDHSRHHRHHAAASGTNHQQQPASQQQQQFLRMPGGDAEIQGAMMTGVNGGGASMIHGGGECPCRYHHHYHHPSPAVDDSVWDKLANKIDQLVESRVQQATMQHQQQQQYHKHECSSSWKQDEVRLEDLELATARLDRRLIALENQVAAAWRSHPHTNMHAQQSNSSSSNHPPTTTTTSHVDDDATTRSHQLQYECQSLYGRLTEEQRKTKHLEQQHVEFHKRQTEDMLKMEKLQQQVNALRAELRQYKGGQQQQQGKRAGVQQQQQQRRPGPPMHHPSAPVTMTTTTHHRLPTPGSSPSSTGRVHKNQQQHHQRLPPQKHQPQPNEDGSVREEDGYLVFNTNINGELIHCKVKIPTSAASSPTIQHHRPAHHYSKPMSDFPLALVSPPITRAGTPTTTMRVDKNAMMMIPPLSKSKKGMTTSGTGSGLNPNAPEWKNGTWK